MEEATLYVMIATVIMIPRTVSSNTQVLSRLGSFPIMSGSFEVGMTRAEMKMEHEGCS
jgi:hypothetical protein